MPQSAVSVVVMRNTDQAQHFYDHLDVWSPAPTLQQVRRMEKTSMTKPTDDKALVSLSEQPFTWKTLTAIANTEFVPKAYRGQPDKMLGAILYGRESGLGPMTSLQMVDMVDGKPSMSAELMVALVRRAGHSIMLEELDAESCTVTGRRTDSGDSMTYRFSMVDAERAGLAGRGAWKTYPSAMLWARAVSQLVRMLFPDVAISFHAYTAEELGHEIPSQMPPEPPQGTEPDRVVVDTVQAPPVTVDAQALPIEYAADDPERPM